MKQRKTKSIQSSIFRFISSIIVVMIVVFIALYYITMSQTFVRNYMYSSLQLNQIVSSQLDNLVRELDLLQRKLLESMVVREYIFVDLPREDQSAVYLAEREFDHEVFSLSGYDYPFLHMSIISGEGYLVSFGEQYQFQQVELTETHTEILRSVYEKKGALVVRPPESPKIEPEYAPSISLMRAFSLYPLNPPKAVIELQLSNDKIAQTIEKTVASYDTLLNQVLVVDENHQLVYPKEIDPQLLTLCESASSEGKIRHPDTGETELLTRHLSPYTGWTTYVITPHKAITANTREYLTMAVALGVAALIVLLWICYIIARNISSPIIEMKNSLSELTLDTLEQENSLGQANYNELELLNESFQHMKKRLEKSISDYLAMQSLSVQAQVMALQSQINPHFLYNTLSIIGIVAEENEDFQVAEMTHQLVDMLRYSSDDRLSTTLGKEILHAENYARLMKVRFEKKMQFDFLMDPALSTIETPPMIIQPLIENCVKYAGTGKKGKLIIVAVGEVTETHWVIQISDNGKGFSDRAISQFQSAVDSTETMTEIYRSDYSGIGLANIYRRLDLYYSGDIIFKIDNSDYGAIVTIGGALKKAKGDLSEYH